MIATNPRVVIVAYNESGIRIGETHHNARIPDVLVDRIRELHEDEGWGYVAISQELNLSLTAVRKICTYERRAQTPVRWKRVKLDQVSYKRAEADPALCTPFSEMTPTDLQFRWLKTGMILDQRKAGRDA